MVAGWAEDRRRLKKVSLMCVDPRDFCDIPSPNENFKCIFSLLFCMYDTTNSENLDQVKRDWNLYISRLFSRFVSSFRIVKYLLSLSKCFIFYVYGRKIRKSKWLRWKTLVVSMATKQFLFCLFLVGSWQNLAQYDKEQRSSKRTFGPVESTRSRWKSELYSDKIQLGAGLLSEDYFSE